VSRPAEDLTRAAAAIRQGGSVALARGFRPFFLCAGIFATGLVPLWLAILSGLLPPHTWLAPTAWHAHEMLFGFAPAAVAGFLTTSVPVWTETQPLSGARLGALVSLWLAGRVAMAVAGAWPAGLFATVDAAFLPTLAAVVAVPILRARQPRNYGVVAILALLSAANLLVHLEAIGAATAVAGAGLRLGIDLLALLVLVIGGRITPAFTRNALLRAGAPGEVVSRRWLDGAALACVAAFVAVDLAAPRTTASGLVALAGAFLVAGRMLGWQTRRTLRDPLLWSLHVGHGWVAVGLLCVGASDLGAPLPWTAGLHALTAGAFGTMILAVMSRVALGHTGRALAAPRGMALAYLLVGLGAALRVVGPSTAPGAATAALWLAGALWSGAFAIFTVLYAPVLLRPRIDGQPG
jgi:uncharacterized protein involved in response to NO